MEIEENENNEIPRPLFPETQLTRSTRSSPPKRLTRQERKGLMSPNRLDLANFPDHPPAVDADAELRAFCDSNELSDMAHRYGVLPPPSFSPSGMELIKTIDDAATASQPMTHPYANRNKIENETSQFYADSFITESSGTVPLELPIPEGLSSQQEVPLRSSVKVKEEEEEYVSPPRSTAKPRRTITKRGGKAAKPPKGLRNLSHMVVEKVEEKGTTTYNQVSEELVEELKKAGSTTDGKNIKRRVYDALNVLRAINIISKDKKEISWVGLPQHSAQALNKLRQQKEDIIARIAQKQENHQEATKQLRFYKLITARNKNYSMVSEDKKVVLPFILASSPSGSQIDCEMADNRSEYCISFQNPFKLYTEVQLLEMMNLDVPTNNYAPSYNAQPSHISPSSIIGPSRLDTPQ